jgi:hypothetical protein
VILDGNSSLWAPNFWLPTARSAAQVLDYNYYSVDLDLGEMFLNFPFHPTLQEYSGIDLIPYKAALGYTCHGPLQLRWARTWMGARPSPFTAVVFYYLGEDFVRGNRLDQKNPFCWDHIRRNLPGSTDYDPTKPRVMKWDAKHKWIACDVVVFVDVLRG